MVSWHTFRVNLHSAVSRETCTLVNMQGRILAGRVNILGGGHHAGGPVHTVHTLAIQGRKGVYTEVQLSHTI